MGTLPSLPKFKGFGKINPYALGTLRPFQNDLNQFDKSRAVLGRVAKKLVNDVTSGVKFKSNPVNPNENELIQYFINCSNSNTEHIC